MFRHKLIADAMIFVILFSLSVHVSMIGISNLSRRVFSGIVYASPGVPVSGAYVVASGPEGYGSAYTNSLGQYSITEGLKTGNYTVEASADGYLEDKVENVSVTAGQETSNIDLYLSLSGGISGKVTDAVSGSPLQYVWVSASNATGDGPYGGSDFTDANGNYYIIKNLATGTYNVTVSYPEGHLPKTVSSIAVTAGVETKNVDLALERSGIISGKVTDAVSGLPLQNIWVSASNATGGGTYGGFAFTNASGNYRIGTNLATGTYNVSALYPEGHLTKTVSGIAVTAGVETTNVNLALSPSGIISGRVTATPSGEPLEDASVTAFSDFTYFGSATTNATGYYKISSGLGNGAYTVMAMFSGSFGQVADVDVVEGQETSNVDIAIPVSPPPPSGIITGKVTDTDGKAIEDALVTAEGPEGSGEDSTDSNGNYVISSGLGTGTYTVNASASGYSTQSVSGVSVTVGQVTPNINFQLPELPPELSGRISGTVQGDANPIPEFQYPFAILLIVTSVAVVLVKLINGKARRVKPT